MKTITWILIIGIAFTLFVPMGYAEPDQVIRLDNNKFFTLTRVKNFFINLVLTIIIWRVIMTILNIFVFKRKKENFEHRN